MDAIWKKQRIETINLSRIESISPVDKHYDKDTTLEELLKSVYYKEPVRIAITNKRNALERAMLHYKPCHLQSIYSNSILPI